MSRKKIRCDMKRAKKVRRAIAESAAPLKLESAIGRFDDRPLIDLDRTSQRYVSTGLYKFFVAAAGLLEQATKAIAKLSGTEPPLEPPKEAP